MSYKTGKFTDIDEWAEEVAKAVIENGGYIPRDVPILWPPGSSDEEREKLNDSDNADGDCDESAL